MYEITVNGHFEAAHYLRGYRGKCENVHGHRYQVVVTVEAARTNEIGIACDFTVLKKHLREILSRYDHACLNDITPFDEINPSAENIAATIYDQLKSALAAAPVRIRSVAVWESPEQGATYRPD
ncbi:MAG: 6-carboxytetrahydropterin synthase QueD [Dehalococcoidales bacterium]|nr:6-carboxytetrahydropterin synthase QueD [Dehalococcoidales bacterium]